MKSFVVRTNAMQVYRFLSTIMAREPRASGAPAPKVLDCGAGGPVPPLALFGQQGFEAWGIDRSQHELDLARGFGQEHGIELHLRVADMRHIPFEDESFDHVYESQSMCHLTKRDTGLAVGEMWRVLKRGGLCSLGVISADSWPKSSFGEERDAGEYWTEFDGEPPTVHSAFTDAEADELVSGWEVIAREKQTRFLLEVAAETSLETWMQLRQEATGSCSEDDWQARYARRTGLFNSTHLHYILRRP